MHRNKKDQQEAQAAYTKLANPSKIETRQTCARENKCKHDLTNQDKIEPQREQYMMKSYFEFCNYLNFIYCFFQIACLRESKLRTKGFWIHTFQTFNIWLFTSQIFKLRHLHSKCFTLNKSTLQLGGSLEFEWERVEYSFSCCSQSEKISILSLILSSLSRVPFSLSHSPVPFLSTAALVNASSTTKAPLTLWNPTQTQTK